MKKFTLTACLLLFTAGPAFADCTIGEPPSIPDGSSATEAQMVEASKAVKAYMVDTEEYQACLTAEGKKGKLDTSSFNKSTDRMEKLADQFNRQLRAFKSR